MQAFVSTTFLAQALGVALVVALLMALNRRGGTRLAGIATAALSAPTLLLLARHEGRDFAQQAALGTLLSTPLCAAAAALGQRWLAATAAPATAPRGPALASALLAGLMSASVCAMARELGALGSGIAGGLPLVAAWATIGTLRQAGRHAAAAYLGAYRRGLGWRALATAVFAAGVPALGGPAAMALALAACGLWAWRGSLAQRAARWP